jgi:hypothetical protein
MLVEDNQQMANPVPRPIRHRTSRRDFWSSMVQHNAQRTDRAQSTDFSTSVASVAHGLVTARGQACRTDIEALPAELPQSGLTDLSRSRQADFSAKLLFETALKVA